MTERKARTKARATAPSSAHPAEAEEAERKLGRAVSIGLPVCCLLGAVGVGVFGTLGSAMLVLASGALLGTIALLWASVRTLSGDAPLPADLEALAARRHAVDDLGERKARALRALKDLESEHALGKIDDADYETFVARYRDEAKAVMQQMDLEVAPLREEAERIAREYLAKRGHVAAAGATDEDQPLEPAAGKVEVTRPTCSSCQTSNEPDAAFCKKCGAALKPAETADASS